jgi:hypothetical protein
MAWLADGTETIFIPLEVRKERVQRSGPAIPTLEATRAACETQHWERFVVPLGRMLWMRKFAPTRRSV